MTSIKLYVSISLNKRQKQTKNRQIIKMVLNNTLKIKKIKNLKNNKNKQKNFNSH